MTWTPLPGEDGEPDVRGAAERAARAWRTWLQALAIDAEAAIGAALAYEALDSQGRGAFLDALEQDAPNLGVPKVAVFAPLLSVERDPHRRERLTRAIGDDLGAATIEKPRALRGVAPNGDILVIVVTSVYLDFVHTTSCRFSTERGVSWVREDPLIHAKDAPKAGVKLDEVELESVPLGGVIDEVARSVVAQRRGCETLPEYLRPLLELFDAPMDDNPEAGRGP